MNGIKNIPVNLFTKFLKSFFFTLIGTFIFKLHVDYMGIQIL